MYQTFEEYYDDQDLPPDAGVAFRHALQHALTREFSARRRPGRAIGSPFRAYHRDDPSLEEIDFADLADAGLRRGARS